MRRVLVTAVIAAGLLAACGSSGSSTGAKPSTTSSPATTSTAALTGRPTQWRDVTAEWKSRAPRSLAKGPDAVAQDLAALWRGGDTSRVGMIDVVAVRRAEPLVVVLRETGGANAGVVGTEVQITLEGGDEGWAVASARAQDTCIEVVEAEPTRCV